jgi:acyl-coenzyme A synthetase/AMP-(fatty) acid ligase
MTSVPLLGHASLDDVFAWRPAGTVRVRDFLAEVAVGTVPVQHSYGFESTFLLALHGGCAFWAGKPFYPQDIASALAAVPQPRLLVTTPFHLSALLASGIDLPAIDLLLSATAPLSTTLAAEAEARTGAPLLEIYGSTESGQLASRRTTEGAAWTLLPGVRLEQAADETLACAGHVEGRVALSDVIELLPDNRFLLHGRHADLINIAGKRTSLAYLNHQLAAVPGVVDGAFFLPDEEGPTASPGSPPSSSPRPERPPDHRRLAPADRGHLPAPAAGAGR